MSNPQVYKDRRLFPGGLPDSPPDSGSEHLMSPGSSGSHAGSSSPHQQMILQQQQQQQQQQHYGGGGGSTMDLSNIDYTLPMQLIEGGQDYQQVSVQT